MSVLTDSPAWKALSEHYQEMSFLHMRDLFARDPKRFERFSLHLGDIFFDYSKNRITEKTVSLLMGLARQEGLAEKCWVLPATAFSIFVVPSRAWRLYKL